jgi:hypothetical protein
MFRLLPAAINIALLTECAIPFAAPAIDIALLTDCDIPVPAPAIDIALLTECELLFFGSLISHSTWKTQSFGSRATAFPASCIWSISQLAQKGRCGKNQEWRWGFRSTQASNTRLFLDFMTNVKEDRFTLKDRVQCVHGPPLSAAIFESPSSSLEKAIYSTFRSSRSDFVSRLLSCCPL